MIFEDITLVDNDYADIHKVSTPHLVYKYRSWNAEDRNHDNVLRRNELFMAYPASFVDEYDCRNTDRYDLLTDDEIRQWTEKMLRLTHTSYNDEAIARDTAHFTPRKIAEFRDKETMRRYIEDEWGNYNVKAGILSLCIQPLNMEMWDMYSHNHTGICYGFSTNDLIRECKLGGGGHVNYEDELPHIHPFDEVTLNASKRAYYKYKHWEFEEEYRLRTFSEANEFSKNRVVTFPDSVLKEVTLGANFDPMQIGVIKEQLLSKSLRPELFHCMLNSGILERVPIPY